MDACRPKGFSSSNSKNSNTWQPSSSVGTNCWIVNKSPAGSGCEWDTDQRIIRAIALSRLVHPTSTGFEYAARLKFGAEANSLEYVYPSPGRNAYTVVAPGTQAKDQRHWLNHEEWNRVSGLLKKWPAVVETKPRLLKALICFEKAARTYEFENRIELLVLAGEALWGYDWESGDQKCNHDGRGRRFRKGLLRSAGREGVKLTEDEARRAWDFRSFVTHAATLPACYVKPMPNSNANGDDSDSFSVYLKTERVLRDFMCRAIEDDEYSKILESEGGLGEWLEDGGNV